VGFVLLPYHLCDIRESVLTTYGEPVLNNLSSVSRNKSSVFLLVLALIVGGVGAQAAGLLNTSSGGYLVCVNSKTKVVTHPGTSTCPKGNKKLVLGAQGVAGVDGITGAAGLSGKDGAAGKDGKTLWNGVKDPESTWGAPGDMFINSVTKTLFGPKNLDGSWPAGVSMVGPPGAAGVAGPAGPSGPQGPGGGSGPAGAPGVNGTNATLAITELLLCDGPDAGTVADEKCKIGMTGPGGGTIFFVDYNDIYPTFNYLEAAPTSCESAPITWSSANTAVTAALGWAGRAVGAGYANTAAIKAVFTADTDNNGNNAAYFATSCPAGGKSDWFLGSLGEMKLMYDNLQGVGGFVESSYWSSTEDDTNHAWRQSFANGGQNNGNKDTTYYVRPVRAF
jgi:Protein of unknown function (DUF1566)